MERVNKKKEKYRWWGAMKKVPKNYAEKEKKET